MQAERKYLHEVVFPRVMQAYQAAGHSLEIVDPRFQAASEEDAEGVDTLDAALDQAASCRPYFLCLLGNNYGKVILEVPDAIGRKYPAVRHFFRTARVHLECLVGVIREPHLAEHSYFYFRKPQIVTTLFAADKADFFPNNKMDALNEVEAHKLEIFKEALVRTGRPVFYYSCQWDSMNRSLTGFDTLGARVENDLLSMVGLAAPSAAVVQDTVPGSMVTEEMSGGSILAAGAVAGAAVAGAAALAATMPMESVPEAAATPADDNAFDAFAAEEAAAAAPAEMADAASAFNDDDAINQIVAEASEVPDDGSAAMVAEEPVADETVISDAAAEAAAGEILGGENPFDAPAASDNPFESPLEEVAADDAGAMLTDGAVADADAEAAALDIFGEDAPPSAPTGTEASFEVDSPVAAEDDGEIVAVEEAVEEDVVEVAAEEEEAPKKKKGGWFGKKK